MNCCCPEREIRVAGKISSLDASNFRYEIKPTRTGPHPDSIVDNRNQDEIKYMGRVDTVRSLKNLKLRANWDQESLRKRMRQQYKKSEKGLLEDNHIAQELTLQGRRDTLRHLLAEDILRYNQDLLAVGKAIYAEPL